MTLYTPYKYKDNPPKYIIVQRKAVMSTLIKRKDNRPRRYFLCVGEALLLGPEDPHNTGYKPCDGEYTAVFGGFCRRFPWDIGQKSSAALSLPLLVRHGRRHARYLHIPLPGTADPTDPYHPISGGPKPVASF